MTDTNNELLHQVTCIAREYRDGILDDTLMVREMTAALSARASAGEGGECKCSAPDKYICARNEGNEGYACACECHVWKPALTAAPRPAQAGASGGWAPTCQKCRMTNTRPGECAIGGQHCQCPATPASPATGDAATWEEEIRRHDATPPAHGDGEGGGRSLGYPDILHECHYPNGDGACQECSDLAQVERVRVVVERAVVEHCEGADLWLTTHLAAKKLTALTTRPTPEAQEARDVWIPVSERLPDEGTECLVLVQYGTDPKVYVAIDTWRMQREAPVSFSSATIETGLMWDENDFLDVLMWQPIKRPSQSAIDAALALPAQGEG